MQRRYRIKIVYYNIKLYFHKNKHNFDKIFENTQKIDISKIICNIYNKNNKSKTYNNKFYMCNICKINICPLCKLKHDKNHNK